MKLKKIEPGASPLCVKRDGLGIREVMDCTGVMCVFVCVCVRLWLVYVGVGALWCFMPQKQETSYLSTHHLSMNRAFSLLPHHITVAVT